MHADSPTVTTHSCRAAHVFTRHIKFLPAQDHAAYKKSLNPFFRRSPCCFIAVWTG